MDLAKLKALVDLLAGSPIEELEIEEAGHRIRLVKRRDTVPGDQRPSPVSSGGGSPAEAAEVRADGAPLVVSPLFGTCHLAPGPGAPPFVAVGDGVTSGQPVCLIEAMKVFNTVAADRDGRVEAILVSDGQEVEVGTPLIRIRV